MDKPIEVKLGNIFFKIISTFLPIKKRIFFISSHKDKLLENSQILYDNLDCEKKVFTYNLPHSIPELIKLSYYIMTSKLIVIDDYCYYFAFIRLKEQQKLIQLWHSCGGGMKKIGLDVSEHHPYEEFSHDQYDNFIVCSDVDSKIFLSAFNIEEDVLTKIGYPRIDSLINNPSKYQKEFYDAFPDLVDKKIICFMPTFRLNVDRSFREEYDFKINWDDLNEFLNKNNSIFLIKKHPSMIDRNILPKEYNNIIDVGDVSNYPLLAASDLLITDYSSIFVEYLLFNKPIIFYCPDLEEYSKITESYTKIPDELPGKFCQNYEELINELSNSKNGIDYSHHREKILKYCDGNSTKKLLKLIEKYLE